MCVRETGVRFTFAHSWMCVRDRLVCTSLMLHIAARMRPRTRGKVLARTSMAASILAQKYAPSLCFGFVTESGDRFEFGEDASHALA